MIKAVIFDMDGLMFDTEQLNIVAWASVGAANGLAFTREILLEAVGLGPDDTKAVLESHLGALPNFFELRAQRIQYVQQHMAEYGVPFKKGLLELLDYLQKNHFKIALATSTQQDIALPYLENAGLVDYFDQMVFGDMIENRKPAPDIYNLACELLGTDPADCLTLEDSPVGVTAAYLAGTRPVMVPDLVQPDDALSKMLNAKVDSLLDVIGLLVSQMTHEQQDRDNHVDLAEQVERLESEIL